MSTLQDTTRTIAVLRALQDLVTARLDDAKHDALCELTDLGVERVSATLSDGTLVAHVTRVAPVAALKLTDDEAALAWAQENAPDLVEHVPERMEVIAAHDRLAIGAAEELVRRMEEDGEAIPGVHAQPKAPFLQVRFAPKGRELIASELKRHSLANVAPWLLEEGEK